MILRFLYWLRNFTEDCIEQYELELLESQRARRRAAAVRRYRIAHFSLDRELPRFIAGVEASK